MTCHDIQTPHHISLIHDDSLTFYRGEYFYTDCMAPDILKSNEKIIRKTSQHFQIKCWFHIRLESSESKLYFPLYIARNLWVLLYNDILRPSETAWRWWGRSKRSWRRGGRMRTSRPSSRPSSSRTRTSRSRRTRRWRPWALRFVHHRINQTDLKI